jgi:hypothetical protein
MHLVIVNDDLFAIGRYLQASPNYGQPPKAFGNIRKLRYMHFVFFMGTIFCHFSGFSEVAYIKNQTAHQELMQ